MLHRLRFLLTAVILLVVAFPAVSAGFTSAVVPEKIDLVVIVNNSSGLPLGEIISGNPAIPAPAKEMFNAFVKGMSFNPLTDITAVQVMARVGEEAWAVAAHGTFDSEKIMAQLKVFGEKDLNSSKVKDLAAMATKDGKGLLCCPEKNLCVFGTPAVVEKFVDAHLAKKGNPDYEPLLAKVSDKAFLTVMAAGDALGKKLIGAFKAQGNTVKMGAMEAHFKAWSEEWFLGGITGKTLFANQLNDRFELWLTYDRPDAKNCSYHFLSETTDPRFMMDSSIREFMKVLAKAPAPVAEPAPAAPVQEPAKDEEKKGESKDDKKEDKKDGKNQDKKESWKKKSSSDEGSAEGGDEDE